jgi:hypothetical protein
MTEGSRIKAGEKKLQVKDFCDRTWWEEEEGPGSPLDKVENPSCPQDSRQRNRGRAARN